MLVFNAVLHYISNHLYLFHLLFLISVNNKGRNIHERRILENILNKSTLKILIILKCLLYSFLNLFLSFYPLLIKFFLSFLLEFLSLLILSFFLFTLLFLPGFFDSPQSLPLLFLFRFSFDFHSLDLSLLLLLLFFFLLSYFFAFLDLKFFLFELLCSFIIVSNWSILNSIDLLDSHSYDILKFINLKLVSKFCAFVNFWKNKRISLEL